MWSLGKFGGADPGCKSSVPAGFRLASQRGKESLAAVWFRCCWNFPGITLSVRAPFGVTEILLEWLFCIKTTGISRNTSSAYCHLCTYVLVALDLPLRSSGFTLLSSFWAKTIYQSTRFCQSRIQVRMLFQLNPALNPVWLSDPFNLPMFIWSMLLPSLNLLPKERVTISCDDCTAGVNEFLNN